MRHFAFSFDVRRCSGCMACVVACQDQNDPGAEGTIALRHVTKMETGAYPAARIDHVSLSCQHCGEAPCLGACPTTAIHREGEDGAVVVDRDRCLGCHSCALACPFGAIMFASDGLMEKCDLCHTRREHGMKPACVLVCPSGALDAGPVEELSLRKVKDASIRILRALVVGSSGGVNE